MKVGITFDLKLTWLQQGLSHEQVAEFDSEETIAGIESALNELGFTTERIGNIIELTTALANNRRWDLVFNISEGYFGTGREAQVPTILDAFQIPYVFSDPLVLSVTLHKAMAKHIIKNHGIPTAPFAVIKDKTDIEKINLEYPIFIKPVSEGSGKGISHKSLIYSYLELVQYINEMPDDFNNQILVEEFLPGREFTVGIVGTGKDAATCGIMEIVSKKQGMELIYSLHTKDNYLSEVSYLIPEQSITQKCNELALAAWNALECRDGGRVDIRIDRHGVPNFIEINPLAGLNPIHSDLPILCRMNGISYSCLIDMIMQSALKRINKTK
ncbi:MAG TPA: ATP-grasp domain-containing protein [Bacteroidales bacterium]|nr:ATP-grasp domain-containing protein [Bacteroidales bacterium]